MKISFDLDDTLIPSGQGDFPTISRNLFQLLVQVEPLRKGSVQLIKKLKSEGHLVGIYTASFRSRFRIWLQFFLYGISVSFIVNERLNRKTLKILNISASKYPPVFGIDLHIDDSQGVGIEGERFDFQTFIINKDDLKWDSTVLVHINSDQLSNE